jgi:hypothetical protein
MDVVLRVVFTVGAIAVVAHVVAIWYRSRARRGKAAVQLLASPRVLATGLALGIGGLLIDYFWSLFFLPF